MLSILSNHNMLILLSRSHTHGLEIGLARAYSNYLKTSPNQAKLHADKPKAGFYKKNQAFGFNC